MNLREKLSKIGLVENFDFWSKVSAKVKVNCSGSKSTVSANGSDPCSPGRIRVVRVGSVRVNDQPGDVVLTRQHC